MAAVYLCRDPDGRAVAVKWLELCLPGSGPEDQCLTPPLLRRFEAEVRALSRLDHPGLVRYRDHGVFQERPFVVMDHVEGSDLRVYAEKLAQRPSAERYARARTIGQALCEAVGAMHAIGLVHRDVKPSNVLVDATDRVVLSDMGVVKDMTEVDRTQAGLVVGTIAYAAPEQLEGGDVDARTDLYGVGATLYFLLTGRRPFDISRRRTPQVGVVPPSRYDPELPADLEAVVLRLMATRPADRYPDAASAARALAERDGQAGPALAGRRQVVEEVTRILDQLEEDGGSLVLEVQGQLGVGRSWLAAVVKSAAARRGMTVVEPGAGAGAAVALGRAASEPGVVVLTLEPLTVPPGVGHARVALHPLDLADVRRTLVAAAPLVSNPSQVAERLHRWSGGLPALLLPLIEHHLRGARMELPEECPVLPAVDAFFEGLELDELEVLAAVGAAGGAATQEQVQEISRLPPEDALQHLQARGMVRRLGERWTITAGMILEAAWMGVPDPEALRARAAALAAAQGASDVEPRVDPTDMALDGRLAQARDAARSAVDEAVASGDRGAECRARCDLGQVLLDLGQVADARRSLANASALAKAAEDEPARRRSHLLRARAGLDALLVGGGSERAAGAAALDRLAPLGAGADEREDPLDALVFAVWSRASATLGDRRSAAQARKRAEFRLEALPDGLHSRTVLELARSLGADVDAIERSLSMLRPGQAERPLVAFEIAALRARARGQAPPPVPDALCLGLDEDERAGLGRRAGG